MFDSFDSLLLKHGDFPIVFFGRRLPEGSGSVGEIREVLMALDASLILASAGQAPREVRNTLGIFYIVNMMLIYG